MWDKLRKWWNEDLSYEIEEDPEFLEDIEDTPEWRHREATEYFTKFLNAFSDALSREFTLRALEKNMDSVTVELIQEVLREKGYIS